MNSFPLCQDLGQVAVVEAGVFLAGRDDRRGSDLFGNGVPWLAAPVTVDRWGRSFPPVGRQNSPDLVFTDPRIAAA